MFNNYLPSYGERPNDFSAVIQCKFKPHVQTINLNSRTDLCGKFKEILRQNSPEARSSYFYATTVIVSFSRPLHPLICIYY